MDGFKKYPPKIEKILRERGLIDKNLEEKKSSHERAMKKMETIFSQEERLDFVKAYEELR